jgi:hypothetical protein
MFANHLPKTSRERASLRRIWVVQLRDVRVPVFAEIKAGSATWLWCSLNDNRKLSCIRLHAFCKEARASISPFIVEFASPLRCDCARLAADSGGVLMFHWFLNLFGQLLLPVFIVALLFSLLGVGPEVVLKSATSIVVSLISGVCGVLKFAIAHLVAALKGKAPGRGSSGRGGGRPPKAPSDGADGDR